MSIQHIVSSIDDLITYTDGEGYFYDIDFRIKVFWFLMTLLTAVISLDMIFTLYFLICTLTIQKSGNSPVFLKIRRNKALVTFVFALVFISFILGFLNRALVMGDITQVVFFFFLTRSIALGFIAIILGTLYMSILQTTRTIKMTAGRGPRISILAFLTLRSVPLIAYHLNNVIDAQRARGLEMEKFGLKSIVSGIRGIFIPLLVLLTGSIDRTSKVLEARGINPRVKNKTSYIKPKIIKTDVLLIFYAFIQFFISLWLAINFSSYHETTTLTYRLFSQWGLI
ncbi:MAG: energy-coupling factor transporter transmembrane component T family protein [Candidatus Hodarchaeales archaeon]|jgi:energy-coupling factor transporter transmembrane protein EcfT